MPQYPIDPKYWRDALFGHPQDIKQLKATETETETKHIYYWIEQTKNYSAGLQSLKPG